VISSEQPCSLVRLVVTGIGGRGSVLVRDGCGVVRDGCVVVRDDRVTAVSTVPVLDAADVGAADVGAADSVVGVGAGSSDVCALVGVSLRGRRAGGKMAAGCPPTPLFAWDVSPCVSLAPGP
jgi:hypothetical protein